MIILKQKEYNIVSDLKYSGIKRALKKNIGRVRRNLAGKIDKSIENDLINKIEVENKGNNLSKALHNIPETTNLAQQELKKIPEKELELVIKPWNVTPEISSDYKTLVIPPNISAGELNHELGHIRNHKGTNGRLARTINRLGQTPESAMDVGIMDFIKEDPDIIIKAKRKQSLLAMNPENAGIINKHLESTSLSDSAKRLTRGKLLVQDEKNASKWSLKRIKKNLSPEVFNLERERQRVANDTYKHTMRASSKIPIRNMIQIPSKRGDFKFTKLKQKIEDDRKIASKINGPKI
jgi:hypothetical protein